MTNGIVRNHHWTDIPTTKGAVRKRRIGNYLNYQTPEGRWLESRPGISASNGPPNNWDGTYEFRYHSPSSALQIFLADGTDDNNRAMIGVRYAYEPSSWINIKAKDAVAGWPEIDGNTARWGDIWTNTDLVFYAGRGVLSKELVLKASGHPLIFEFTVLAGLGHTFVFGTKKVLIKNSSNETVLALQGPSGYDAEGKLVRGEMENGGLVDIGGKDYQVIRLEFQAEAFSGIVYPITIDPTIILQISGNVIEDTYLDYHNGDNNYGGAGIIRLQGSPVPSPGFPGLIRMASNAIPDGTIHSVKLHFYKSGWSGGVPITLKAYIIKAMNSWVEGSEIGASVSGVATFNECISGIKKWAGHPVLGCSVPDTDYIDDPNPPSIIDTVGIGYWMDWEFPVDWFCNWRDGVIANNGFIIFNTVYAYVDIPSQESGSYFTYFEFEYEPIYTPQPYRGKLIFPFLAEIAQLDTLATAADPDGAGPLESGYDSDFNEPIFVPDGTKQLGTYTRKEKDSIRIPCQVEPDTWDAMQQLAGGIALDAEMALIFHFQDLENMGLIDIMTGDVMIRIGDRLVAIYDLDGKLIQSVTTPPGLYVQEVKPIGFGLNMQKPSRNLLMVAFSDRRQGLEK